MSTYQHNKHFYSNYYNDGIPKLEHLDKIEGVLTITDPNEMDNSIFKNILTISKILKCIYKRLCDNYFLSKEEIELLLYTLKFVDTLNLFMNKQSIEQISGLIYEINEMIFSMHNFDAKEMILKKIRYTEMTIIYFKKKYFKNLFFGEGKLLGNEIEKCLELVTQNGTFDQKTFKQMQNIFYVVQGKIDDKYRSEIQNKMNELKTLSLKHKSEKYSINDDYKDYVNSKNFSNDDYYENFNENNIQNPNNNNTTGTTNTTSPNSNMNNNNYSYYGNSGKSNDNNSFYNCNYDNFYYQWKKTSASNNKQTNYKNKYYNYNHQNFNKGNTYLVELPSTNTNTIVTNSSAGNDYVINNDFNSNKVGLTYGGDDLITYKNTNPKEVPIASNHLESNHPVNEEVKPAIPEPSQNLKNNIIGAKDISECPPIDYLGNKSEGQTKSNSNGPKNIQNYYNDNFFKNYVYYYEKPVMGITKENNISTVTNTPLANTTQSNTNTAGNNNNLNNNNNMNTLTESLIQTTSNSNTTLKANTANSITPVKVNNNSNKQHRNKYKRTNKMTTYEQVLYSDNNSCTDNNKATTNNLVNTATSDITPSNKVEEVNMNMYSKGTQEQEENTLTVEIQPHIEKEEERSKVVNDPLKETSLANNQQQISSIQSEIGKAEPSNQNYNKKGYNNNYNNYKNNNYKNYNMAYSNNYNYSNYGYNNGNYYTKNNYYNNSVNSNNTAYEYDYNYNTYAGSNKTYKNEVESNYTNSTNSNKNTNSNKEVNNNVSNFNSHSHNQTHNYNYNYNNNTNYKKNSLTNNTVENAHSQSNNYYNNNFKNIRTKNNTYSNKYRNSYDYTKKYDNTNTYREVDLSKLENSESVDDKRIRKESNYIEEQNTIVNQEEKVEKREENQENIISNIEDYIEQHNANLLNNNSLLQDSTITNKIEEKKEEDTKVQENPSNYSENIQMKEIKKETSDKFGEDISTNNSKTILENNCQEISQPAYMNNLYNQENRSRLEMMYPDNLNPIINRGELVEMDVEKMFAADIHPRNTDSDVYNEENFQYDEEEEESADEQFEEQEEEEDEEEDEEIQNIIDNEIEQLNARHAENRLMHEEDEEGDSDSAENDIIEAEFDKFMRDSKMSLPNNINVNYNIKENEDNFYGNETKNNKIIFEDDDSPLISDNKNKENTKENENEETVEIKSTVNIVVDDVKNEQNTKITENNTSEINNNLTDAQTEEKNMKETTKNFMDSLKNIDPKLLMEIKNKINENNIQTNNTIVNSQFNQFNQFGFQGPTFPTGTPPLYPTTHINPLNLEPTTHQSTSQNQISYEDYIKQHQMNFTGLNQKLQLQNFIFTNYSHFFYRGRDSNIHREYFALKCLEQENSPIITNNLEAFEKKILIPIYQRINFNVNKKKGIYLYTFTKYKKLIYRVLSKEKILKKVKPYGSYMNNFLIDSGDIDICIVPKCSILEFSNSLEKIKEEIISNNYGEHKLTHQNSRYMLLKIVDHQTKFVIDITVHNMLPILNTNLIRLYSLYDQRFHILGLYIKHWSKINKIHGAADNYLSSYAMLMMLIYFLQNVVEPKVLPNLQNVEKKEVNYEFNQNGEMVKTNIYYEEDVQKIKNYLNNLNNGRENKESATQLLLKFFEFYSYYFDYFEQKIAIHKMPNELLKKTHDNIAFSIEDPFDPHHNPGKSMIINSNQFNKFITSMKKEINLIMNGDYIKRLEKMNSSNNN